MGAPFFFQWLSKKYPSAIVYCKEEKPKTINGEKVPVDTSKLNPNGIEFDNLFIDMNGIIHNCCHPDNKPAPKDEEEMMTTIYNYIDKIFGIARPRKILFIAIDGVAPRAKQNQQRSRRFRSCAEAMKKNKLRSQLRLKLQKEGALLPSENIEEEEFDRNWITPGTPFMERLSKCLHYYIHDRLYRDPGWRKIAVIFSDASVPGEGEHKIMDFIRSQRVNKEYDSNTRHCLYGSDADLIMLGLATHELNVTILREKFKSDQHTLCELCGKIGHDIKNCTGLAKQEKLDEQAKPVESNVEFNFVKLKVLREYLSKELRIENLPFKFNLERAIDDWVFMCFFVGNDFLPHLPTLEIREGAIDRLVEIYKKVICKMNGYVTKNGDIDLKRVQLFMTDLAEVENEIIKKRQEKEVTLLRHEKNVEMIIKMNKDERQCKTSSSPTEEFDPGEGCSTSRSLGAKRKYEESDSQESESEDALKLMVEQWKEKYYEEKFRINGDNMEFRHHLAAAYVEGLCWVLRYYYEGCASWDWYFPFHYAPFAVDFSNIGDMKIDFERGQPIKPLEQMMAVFPPANKKLVPESWGRLMSSPESPIIDFYPTDFKIDISGKKKAWQGTSLLPFVNKKRLLNALEAVYPTLTDEEIRRNIQGENMLFVGKVHTGYDFVVSLYENAPEGKLERAINPEQFYGFSGTVQLSEEVIHPKDVFKSPMESLPDLPGGYVVGIAFKNPKYLQED